MRLRSIALANFRSFGGEAEILLGQTTSIIGPNGAGKSNVLAALQKIAAILSGEAYLPDRTDYFDDNDKAEMRLGAAFELHDSEQEALLDRPRTKSVAALHGDLVGGPLFRVVRYTATFKGGALQAREICLSDRDKKIVPFVRATLKGGGYAVDLRNIEDVNLVNSILPEMREYKHMNQCSTEYLFDKLDHSLLLSVRGLFSGLTVIPGGRSIPRKVPVRQADGLTPNGQNLPNELHGLLRAEQDGFDGYMKPVTHGDPLGVEPRTIGSDLVLKAREEGLSRETVHTDLGSGQLQTLILGWQLYRQRGAILVLKEPELHLHAERQRQVLRLIRDKGAKDGTQFVIETHSPVFLGSGSGERTILVTKDAGRSHVIEIGHANVGLIRHELGITHADTLHTTNILFVEGESDRIVFDAFLGIVSPDHALSTMIYSLHGALKTIHLTMLIPYLEAEGRCMFVILDEDGAARGQVGELEAAGLLAGNIHFLAKNLEDEFDSGLVVRAAGEMAAAAGAGFSLDANELQDRRNRGDSVIAAVREHWGRAGRDSFSKTELARRMVGLLDGNVPRGIRTALEVAVSHFEKDRGGGARGTGSAARGAGAGGRP